jgi:hypothetical protein
MTNREVVWWIGLVGQVCVIVGASQSAFGDAAKPWLLLIFGIGTGIQLWLTKSPYPTLQSGGDLPDAKVDAQGNAIDGP